MLQLYEVMYALRPSGLNATPFESKLSESCSAGLTTVQSLSAALARQPLAPVSFVSSPVVALRENTMTVSIETPVPPAST